MGEPAGVGGDIVLAAWAGRKTHELPAFFVIDDAARLHALAARLGLDVRIHAIAGPEEACGVYAQALPVLHRALPGQSVSGAPDPDNCPAVIGAIETAVRLAQQHRIGGLVTNPIHKAALYVGGFSYPGHTEFLAALAGNVPVAMMLATATLKTVPVTIHVALRDAIAALNTATIVATGTLLATALKRDFGIAEPRIAVAGLNPHAGEGGAMGREDIEIIVPAVAALQAQGIAAIGPLPPDTMFHTDARARYDAALCMYHDQALIPIKTLDFFGGVNVTLGLPFVRTSPDHGTALDLAGTGKARPDSLIAALRMAAEMAGHRA
jgi:4-hydroxythreonine-4-phosphate dehydrogenase